MKKSKVLKCIFVVVIVAIIIYTVYYFYTKNDVKEGNALNETSEETTSENYNIRYGISNIDSLNPLISKNQGVQDVSKLVYEPLFNLSNTFKLEKALGTEISKSNSRTYLVKLRENVKWHNGGDFSAKDVKYTIDTIKLLGEEYIYYSNVKNIESVDIVNNNLVKIHVYEEEPFFEYNLTFPVISESFFGLEEDILSSDKNNVPMGTGKYRLDTIDIASQMNLKENTAWWNKENVTLKVNTVTVRIYETIAELYNAYKLGGLDLISTQNPNVEDIIGTIGLNVEQKYGRSFDYLALNTESKMLSDKKVREALSYAINREEIVNSVYGGKYITADYPLEYGSYLYKENKAKKEYDARKAIDLLQEGEWTYSYGTWQKKEEYNTLRLKLNLVVQSSNESRVKVAEIIKNNLDIIGITVNIIKASDRNVRKLYR